MLEWVAISFSRSLLVAGLCGGDGAGSLPLGPKIKAKLKTL